MRILDRYIIRSFAVNCVLALVVMISLVTVLDLIVNFESFTKPAQAQAASTTFSIIGEIIDYYSYQSLVIFQQVAAVVPLLAAGFTMVRMTRHNELTAMLASGVSLYRVAAPIILFAVFFSLLTIVNQEFVISQDFIIQKLLRPHGDSGQMVTRDDPIRFARDEDNSLLTADSYDHKKKILRGICIWQRDAAGAPIGHTTADTATWEVPPGGSEEAWVMTNVKQIDDRKNIDPTKGINEPLKTLIYHTRNLTPQQLDLIFFRKIVEYLDSAHVRVLAESSPKVTQPLLFKMMYLRFTQPLMNIIMLLIGIPFLLTREPNRLIKNMFYCLAVSIVVFASTFVIFQMAGSVLPGGYLLDPLIAAWLPVLIFGPAALVMLDFIRT